MRQRVIELQAMHFEYETAIKIKDIILYLSGISVGIIVTTFVIGSSFYKIKTMASGIGNMSTITVKEKGTTLYYTNPTNFAEAMEVLFTLTLKVIFNIDGREYTLKNRKRTQVVLYVLYIIALLLIILGIVFITNPILRKSYFYA